MNARDARLWAGLSTHDTAAIFGVSARSWQRWERDDEYPPDVRALAATLDALADELEECPPQLTQRLKALAVAAEDERMIEGGYI